MMGTLRKYSHIVVEALGFVSFIVAIIAFLMVYQAYREGIF